MNILEDHQLSAKATEWVELINEGLNKCAINDYCAKQDELYSLQASSSSFKWVLECPANYRDFGDSTASTSFLGKAAKVVSVTPLMSRKNGSYSPSSIYSCIYSIQYRIINSNPFKTTLMSWFSQQLSVEQQFYVKNLCQNFFSVHKSRQFLPQRSTVQCCAHQEMWE